MTINYFKDSKLYKKLSSIKKDETFFKEINLNNVGVMNDRGNTLLFLKNCSSKERVNYLLSLGLDLNYQNEKLENALFYATTFEKAKLLLDLGIKQVINKYKSNFISNICYATLLNRYVNQFNLVEINKNIKEFNSILEYSVKTLKLNIEQLYENLENNFYFKCFIHSDFIYDSIKLCFLKNGKKDIDYIFLEQITNDQVILDYSNYYFQKIKNNQEQKTFFINKLKEKTKYYNIINLLIGNADNINYELIDFFMLEIYTNILTFDKFQNVISYKKSKYKKNDFNLLEHKTKIIYQLKTKLYILKLLYDNNIPIRVEPTQQYLYDFYLSGKITQTELSEQDLLSCDYDLLYYYFIINNYDKDKMFNLFNNFIIEGSDKYFEQKFLNWYSFVSDLDYTPTKEVMYNLFIKFPDILEKNKKVCNIKNVNNIDLFIKIIDFIKTIKNNKKNHKTKLRYISLYEMLLTYNIKKLEIPIYIKTAIYNNLSIYFVNKIIISSRTEAELECKYWLNNMNNYKFERKSIYTTCINQPNFINNTINYLRELNILENTNIKNYSGQFLAQLFLLTIKKYPELNKDIEKQNIKYLKKIFSSSIEKAVLEKHIIFYSSIKKIKNNNKNNQYILTTII